jgi:PhnB protein
MVHINPYLNYNGTAEEAFRFYQSVLGGDLNEINRWKEMPESDKLRPADREKIMHIALHIGGKPYLMATDAIENMGPPLQAGNNFYIAIHPDSKDEATKIFNGLSAGGKVTMPLSETFWGAYFGMFNDKYGIQWMINYDLKKQ